ncbi:MAG: FAD-binding protein, partial [Candidatus Bathyarchaeia archaeon]
MKTLKIEQISTDILIIGGGAAGSWAAIEADRRGVDVLLITKGKLGKSGCSPLAAMYLFPPEGTPGYNPETRFIEEVGSLTRATYLNNQELLRAIVFEASRYVTKLEELGLYWTRYPDGELAIGFTKGKPADIYAITHGDTGKNIMDVLRKEIIRRGIKFLEDTMVTRLLTKNDEVVGATALDYIHGKFLIIRAKSVILAAGGGGCLWKYSTASREVTADGLAIAFRAGAELTNIEFNLWHMADLGRRPGMKPIAWVNL